MKRASRSRLVQGLGVMLAALGLQTADECRAETAYVVQIPVNVTTTLTFNSGTPSQQTGQYHNPVNHMAVGIPGLPEAAGTARGNNLAQALEIGVRNSVYQLQGGAGNISTAGIIGNYGNINVLQAGNNLRSNVVLLNGAGMNVSVLQPAGSAPVNVLIARLPGGGLLIKR